MIRKLERSIRRAAILACSFGILAAATRAEDTPAAPAPASPPAITLAPPAAAADGWERPTGSLSLDYASRYVWRGMVANQDPVLQPSLTLSWYGFSVNAWGNVDTTNYGDHEGGYNDRKWEFSEVDYTLSYSHTFEKKTTGLPFNVAPTLGYISYTFDGTTVENTQEVFFGVGLPDVLLSPTLTAYYDVDECHGWYLNAAVSHSISLYKKEDKDILALILGASLGWGSAQENGFYYGGTSEQGLSDFGLSAGIKYAVTDNFAITPYVKYSDIITKGLNDVRDNLSGATSSQTVFGVNATYSF